LKRREAVAERNSIGIEQGFAAVQADAHIGQGSKAIEEKNWRRWGSVVLRYEVFGTLPSPSRPRSRSHVWRFAWTRRWAKSLERRFAGVVVPRRLNLKDGYGGGVVVRDRDFGSGQQARSSQQWPTRLGNRYPTLTAPIRREPRWSQSPVLNLLRDSLSVDFIRVIMRERHLVIGITDGVVPSSNCRSEFILMAI
jgi:hypothetical protein